jgi:hypothetical protein
MFDPNIKGKVITDSAETPIVVDTREAQKTPTRYQRTPELRLAAAQQACRAHRSENPAAPENWQGGEYYTDFAGPNTSEHEWDIWRALGASLHTQPYFSLGFVSYDRLKAEGVFMQGTQRYRIPINILKAAIETRIQELSLAPHLLWEWLAESHTCAEDSLFFGTPFENRIQRFKAEAPETLKA